MPYHTSRIIDYTPITPAHIQWLTPEQIETQNPDSIVTEFAQANNKAQPYSLDFNDVYYNPEHAVAESEHVFINGNDLTRRFSALKAGQYFCLAETGFGTGLNFLLSCRHFFYHAHEQARLHYFSLEKHPLRPEDLQRALANFPELSHLSDELQQHYPPLSPGLHTLSLFNGRVHLSLFFGDVQLALHQSVFTADAWYLDGFSPSQNLHMWQAETLALIAQHSATNTSFATYTEAGHIRRNLQSLGFNIEKTKGFGRKRHMMIGTLNTLPPPLTKGTEKPWYFSERISAQVPKNVAIIGAGLAGCATAYTLAKAGVHVSLFDKCEGVAQETSSNHAGLTYMSFSHKPTAQSRYFWQSYLYGVHHIQTLIDQQNSPENHQDPANPLQKKYKHGILHLAQNEKNWQQWQAAFKSQLYGYSQKHALLKTSKQLRSDFDLHADYGGIWMPNALAISPQALCHQLIQHPNITPFFNAEITNIQFNSTKKQWAISQNSGDTQTLHFDSVVIANAYWAKQFDIIDFVQLKTIRGQTTSLPNHPDIISHPPTFSLCHNGYYAPPLADKICFGASFNLHSDSTQASTKDRNENYAKLKHMLAFTTKSQLHIIDHKKNDNDAPADTKPDAQTNIASDTVGFRCQTADYFPVVGKVPHKKAFMHDYAKLADGRLQEDFPLATHQPHLYTHIALGSRGLTHCFINAELITSQMLGTPAPVEKDIIEALSPARFIIKAIKRKQPL